MNSNLKLAQCWNLSISVHQFLQCCRFLLLSNSFKQDERNGARKVPVTNEQQWFIPIIFEYHIPDPFLSILNHNSTRRSTMRDNKYHLRDAQGFPLHLTGFCIVSGFRQVGDCCYFRKQFIHGWLQTICTNSASSKLLEACTRVIIM